MKNIKRITVLLLILALVLSMGCAKKEEVTMGELKDGSYTNSFFDLSFQLPNEWHIATEEEKQQLTNAGQEAISGDNEDLDKKLELSKEKTLNLVFAFKYPLDYMGGVNTNFMCIGENLGLAGIQVKTGKDYLDASKALMEQSQLPYQFSEYTTETLGGKEFDVMGATLDLGTLQVQQKVYSTVMKGYALNFSITYSTEEELAELNNILSTIKFE